MNQSWQIAGRPILLSGAILLAALITGAAFAGWLNHGTQIVLTYTQAGLSWCL